MLLLLFYCFLVVATINILFYISFFKFLFSVEKAPQIRINQPVSVVICAKNEAENLQQNLPHILNQDYPEFEVILINDSSSDETLAVMEDFELQDSRVVVVNVESNERFWGNKKYALTLGIKKAKFEKLLFTDADCYPKTNQWLKEMAQGFQPEKVLVLGYGAYEKVKNSFLNKIIRFETLLTALQYFSAAKNGRAYMGVGRNLAYTSTVFYENKGFVSHMNLLSGDDDLFVNEVATKTNTSLVYSEESFTYSQPKKTWKIWFRQKRRHISTAKFYRKSHQFKLGLFYLSQFLFWLLSFVLLAFYDWRLILAAMLVRFAIQYVAYGKAASIFKEKDLLWFLPFQDLCLVSLQFVIFIFNSLSKPRFWK